jgi:hercynine metabolism protein
MSNGADWFNQLEQQLEQQLEAFLRANPAQEQLLQQQEQRERQQRLRRRRLELQTSAERTRGELLQLANEINQWQERVERARKAGAEDLAQRAEAHLAGLMARGRDRWQALGQLGTDYRQLEQELNALADPPAAAAAPDETLDQAWSAFEARQELEQLRRRQQAGGRER